MYGREGEEKGKDEMEERKGNVEDGKDESREEEKKEEEEMKGIRKKRRSRRRRVRGNKGEEVAGERKDKE